MWLDIVQIYDIDDFNYDNSISSNGVSKKISSFWKKKKQLADYMPENLGSISFWNIITE